MEMSAAEAERSIAAGVAALRKGDAEGAKQILHEVIGRGNPLPAPWFLLAQACRHAGDRDGEDAALDKVLEAQPRNIGALIMKGDCYARNGDKRAAGSFYRDALLLASAGGTPQSPIIAAELQRVEAASQQFSRDFEGHLESRLTNAGLPERARSNRFRDALDIMAGRKQVYLQQPTSFYFPGLPQIEFYERSEFPWVTEIEAAIPDIRGELEAVVREDQAFSPYIQHDPDRPPLTSDLLGDPSWSAFHLFEAGAPLPENAGRCPITMEALRCAPMPFIRGRSPMALFSLLKPGAHIPPHTGLFNTRLICHIPLILPPNCSLRVGNQIREWRPGEALFFDDSIEHEAWNRSSETRVVLIFEVWRPEISEDERQALTAMFEAITDYGGPASGNAI